METIIIHKLSKGFWSARTQKIKRGKDGKFKHYMKTPEKISFWIGLIFITFVVLSVLIGFKY